MKAFEVKNIKKDLCLFTPFYLVSRFIKEPVKRRQHMLLEHNSFNTPSSLIRLAAYFALALIVTFSLFAFMQYLIQSPKRAAAQITPEFEIGLYQDIVLSILLILRIPLFCTLYT